MTNQELDELAAGFGPVVEAYVAQKLQPLADRLTVLESQVSTLTARLDATAARFSTVEAELVALRERIAKLEQEK